MIHVDDTIRSWLIRRAGAFIQRASPRQPSALPTEVLTSSTRPSNYAPWNPPT